MNNEAVAWHYPDGKPDQCTTNKEYAEKAPAWTPMYYKREWVGLTRIELIKCGVLPYGMSYELYEAIDQALKEKNT